MISDEQKLNRVGRIGSSDAALILGVSPYGKLSPEKQRRNAYFNIMGLSPRKESNSMRDGVFMEPAIAAFAEWKIGIADGCAMRHTQYIRDGFDWQIASLDLEGMKFPSRERFVTECKYVENPDHAAHWGRAGNTKQESVPDYVLVQVMHQLLVCGPEYTHAYVACYRPWSGFGLYGPIARDEEMIGNLHQVEEKFYRDHILTKTPPVVAEESEAA